MKKSIVFTDGKIVGPVVRRDYKDGDIYTVSVELRGGWLENVIVREYDTFTIGDLVSVCVETRPVSSDEVRRVSRLVR